jgi:hypothetical protein
MRSVLLAGASIGLFLILKIGFFTTPYLQNFSSGSELRPGNLLPILHSETLRAFARSLLSSNLNLSIAMILIILRSLLERRYVPLIFALGSLGISVLLVCAYFPDYGYNIYTEGFFKVLGLMLPVIIIDLFYSWILKNRIGEISLVVNYVFSLMILFMAGQTYADRYEAILEVGEQFPEPVVIQTQRDICPYSFLTMPLESSIINQMERGRNNYFALEIQGHASTLNALKDLRANDLEKQPYFNYGSALKIIPESALKVDLQRLVYDQYSTFRCIHFVRVPFDREDP